MFDLGMAELLLIAIVLVLAVASSGCLLRWVNVNQTWHVTGQGIDLERAILTKLTAMAGCRVITTGDGRISLTQRRTPGWTVVLAILTFPLGLLFLLFKVEHNLNVMITPDERGGSRIDLIGVTRQRTLDALTEALVIEHGADVEPLGVRL